MSSEHEHEDQDHDHGAVDLQGWWKALDVVIWVAVALLVILGTEWLVGLLIREKLAHGFTKLTKAAARKPADAE